MRTDVASPQAWCEGLWQTRREGRRSFLKGTGLAEAAGESKGKKKGWDMWSDLYPIVSGEMWLPQRAGLGPS